MIRDIRLLTEPFVPSTMVAPFSAANPGLGGLCTFVGEVRGGGNADNGDDDADSVQKLELTHYAPLTLLGMHRLADNASQRFELLGLLMLHRIGTLLPGEPIVCVSAAAHHRRAAIDAVDFCMDHLKSAAWFWKRELRIDGWHWIEPRAQDHADLSRWGSVPVTSD